MQWRSSNGPISIEDGAEMVMNGGSIENNKEMSSTGAGASAVLVYNDSSNKPSSFTMNGGTISGNSGQGAAVSLNTAGNNVYQTRTASFTMNGGKIVGNENTFGEGGAIRTNTSNCIVNLLGGEISGNHAPSGGGGVFFTGNDWTQTTITGTKIFGNTTNSGIGNDVLFGGGTQVKGFWNPTEYGSDEYNCWHDDLGGNDYNQTDLDAFCGAVGWTKNDEYYRATYKGFTAAKAAFPPAQAKDAVAYYVPTIYGGNVDSDKYVYFDSLAEAMATLQAGSYTREDGETVPVPVGSTIYLMQDFGETVQVPAVTFTLDLNGYTLSTSKANATIFTLASGANMTLADEKGPDFSRDSQGTLTQHGGFATGRGFYVSAGASLTVKGVRITGFSMVNQYGPAIYCAGSLTIQGSSVTDNVYSGTGNSGAIYVDSADAQVNISGSTFTGNSGVVGAGLAIQNGKILTIENTAFEGNSVLNGGGAAAIRNTPEVTLAKVTFRNNEAKGGAGGGGLATWDNFPIRLSMTDCDFEGNTAGNCGGGAYIHYYTDATITGGSFINNRANTNGGGLCSDANMGNGSNLIITGVTFEKNHTQLDGGGVWARRVDVNECNFKENTAVRYGGGITHSVTYWNVDSLTVAHSNFIGNKAGFGATVNPGELHGGGIYSDYGSLTVTGSNFEGNTASGVGGAIFREHNSAGCETTIGAAKTDTTTEKKDCTFYKNTATNNAGGGIYVKCPATLQNLELWENKAVSGGIGFNTSGEVIIDDCEIYKNTVSNHGGGTIQILGGTITNNRASVGGGIVQVAQSNVRCNVFDGVKLYENVSTISNTGNDIYSAYEGTADWEMVWPRSTMILESAVNMRHPKYNTWRDDVYSDGNYKDEEKLGDGMYITGPIDESSNLQLTAYYYETSRQLKALTSNRKVMSLKIKESDYGAPYVSGIYESPADQVTREEKTAGDMGWAESTETYVDAKGVTQHYLIGQDGKLYERSQMVQWIPSEDGSRNSSLVLTGDAVTYSLTANYKEPDYEGGEEIIEKARVWLEMEVDADASQVNLSGSIPGGFRGYVLTEERNGKTVQVLRCYKEEELSQEDNRTYSITLPILAMKNGDTLKPSFRMWVDGNQANEQNPPAACSDRLTISAVGKYNVTLRQNSKLTYTGYFDTKTGQEASRPEEGEETPEGVVYGTVLGYGITVMMDNTGSDGKNVPTNKGLKGLEIPADGLELELHMKGGLYLDGAPVDLGGGDNTVTPVFWALNENMKSDTGRGYGQSASTFNMNWDDEDEMTICSNYAYDAAPFNTGNNESACYNGGGWTVTGMEKKEKETVVHLKVNGYAFDMGSANPIRNSDGSISDQFGNDYTKPFTAGYLQAIFPFPEEVTKTANGYLSVDMQAVVSDMEIHSASGQTPVTGGDLDVLKAYYGDQAAQHTTNEVRFSDNRVASSNGLYVSHGSGDGSVLGTVNYWLAGNRAGIAGQYGNGTIPLGSQVYMGGRAYYFSGAIPTDEEYFQGSPNPYYIPEDQFNPQTDNKTEFHYITALNMLQKFDADAYTPLSSAKIVNTPVSSGYSENNIYVGSTESATNWGNDLSNLTTSMNLTVLYGAKPDGSNWEKQTTTAQDKLDAGEARWTDETETMILYKGQTYRPDQAVYSDGGVHEMDTYHEGQLIYFETLEDLQAYFTDKGNKDAKCVAILYEARDCCIRTGREIWFEHRMQVTDDFDYTGQTYCTTNEARAWLTYRPDYKQVRGDPNTRKALIYGFNWDDVSYEREAKGFGLEPGEYVPNVEYVTDGYDYEPKSVTITRRSPETVTVDGEQTQKWVNVELTRQLTQDVQQVSSRYKKTEYEYGYQKGGTHNGWAKGNTLLVHTLTSGIQITGGDTVSSSGNNTKTSYNLSLGERIASFVVAPRLEKASGVNNALVSDGSQATQVSIDLTLPRGLRYREGSIAFDYTPVMTGQPPQPEDTYQEGELEWIIGPAETDENGVTTIHLTTYVSDIGKNLPKIRFSGFIGEEGPGDVKNGDTLTAQASIYATYEEHNQLAALATHDSFTIMAVKEGNVGIYQDALTVDSGTTSHSLLTEVGEDFGYKLVYYNEDALSVGRVTLGDVLPYNGDGRTKKSDERFDGGYRIKGIELVFTGPGAAATASKFDESGSLCFRIDETLPTRDDTYKEGWKTLLQNEPTPGGERVYTPTKPGMLAEPEKNRYSFAYDIPADLLEQGLSADLLTRLSTEELGNLLYMDLPDVAGQTYVTVNVLLSPMDETAEGQELITDGEGKTQQGGNKYYNDFVARTKDDEILSSLDVDVTVVQRSITGYAFMDMNQDGRFTLGNEADKHLKGITVTLRTEEGKTACDVTGREIDSTTTDENGRYQFNNVSPGRYTVSFMDSSSEYEWVVKTSPYETKPNKLKFGELAVTQLPGAESGYYQTASDVNRCVADYGSDTAGLRGANLNVTITMPDKGEMKTATVISTNNNAGFYCVEAKLTKDWTGMIREVPAGTELTYHLVGSSGYKRDITILQGKPWSKITVQDRTDGVAEADKLTLAVQATMPSGRNTPAAYHWETVTSFYLPAKDGTGTEITYTFEEELGGAFDPTGYDAPKTAVVLDKTSGQTVFQAENHQRSYDFAFTKVDIQEGNPLAEARFQFTHNDKVLKFIRVSDGVYRASCDNVDVQNGETTGETQVQVSAGGTLTLTGLPEGTVTMTETKAPKGYIKPNGSWTLVFGTDTEGNAKTDIDESGNKTNQPAIKIDEDKVEGTDALGNPTTVITFSYSVPNIKHMVVPITGAEGVGMYLIAGLAIAVAGALLLLEYKRRKRQTGEG